MTAWRWAALIAWVFHITFRAASGQWVQMAFALAALALVLAADMLAEGEYEWGGDAALAAACICAGIDAAIGLDPFHAVTGAAFFFGGGVLAMLAFIGAPERS